MTRNDNVRITSCSLKLHHYDLSPPLFSSPPPLFSNLLENTQRSPPKFPNFKFNPKTSLFLNFTKPLKFPNFFHSRPPLKPLFASISTSQNNGGGGSGGATQSVPAAKRSSWGEKIILISEVLVRNKNGEELESKDLEAEALNALKASPPNYAPPLRDVREDVRKILATGYFSSCNPVAINTRDGIRLEFQALSFIQFLIHINLFWHKFLEDTFRDGYGKVINTRHLHKATNSIDGWYTERGLVGKGDWSFLILVDSQVSGLLSYQEESLEFKCQKQNGEPTVGNTRPETILRQLTTKIGQVYSVLQGKKDENTLLAMGILEGASIVPQLAEESLGQLMITNGSLAGLIGSFTIHHNNLFGKNQKLNLSLERGKIDSIFKINHADPWIEGDDKRTLRSIIIQNSRTPGTLVHGTQPDNGNFTVGRLTAGIEYGRPIRPKWHGFAGLTFQRAGARGDRGNPLISDFYGSPLTASGNAHDNMLLAKVETIYTGSGDPGSSMICYLDFKMEQGIPLLPEWLVFNRVNARASKGLMVGPAHLDLSGNGVRGYEGALGSGRSFLMGSGELSFPLTGPVKGVVFADYGTDLGSGPTVPGDPAGARLKPCSGYGYGVGIRVITPLDPLRLEYAFNDQRIGKLHFGAG
ncbi:OLC1v1005718C1 [Oldenlandia corymbosa var. corymbosa]|uniref:OLC1v1005718C1 n=1 Tax=Oldenlandia corymbosa var. corymbosa TaxID=529605 RepID=A0AAV1DH92_OLDCO|nr:OLC1v1005718C1 [Oldenlandia corymbosa var. corymbosa]